jgi:hypothetical protein
MKRGPKYRNVHTVVDGHVFPSKLEARRYQELKLLAAAGEISDLELQPRYRLDVAGVHICSYISDFRYTDRRGNVIVEDAKGVRTAVYTIKKRLMKAVHGIEIVEVGKEA